MCRIGQSRFYKSEAETRDFRCSFPEGEDPTHRFAAYAMLCMLKSDSVFRSETGSYVSGLHMHLGWRCLLSLFRFPFEVTELLSYFDVKEQEK